MKLKPSLKDAFFKHGQVADCPVYDMHAHMGSFYGSHLPNCEPADMVRTMRRAGVRLVVFAHHHALFSPELGNVAAIDAVRKFPNHFRAYCGVNPNYPDTIERELRTFDRFKDVYVGFKMLSDYHGIPITDARCKPVWEFANRRQLLVLLHTWAGSVNDGPEPIRQIAKKYPRVKLILGHSCHGAWDKAIMLARDFPNVYLELCAVLDDRGILEQFVEELGSRQILFGTDFPWFNHHYCIGAVLGADIGDEDRRNILYRNAQRLLGR
jgi:predicted TIM-barrel fold metal-dependent hydrolase